jgi:plasmid stabilization system protein ParE
MTPVIFTAAAEQDVVDAVDWYEHQAPGVGVRLLAEITAVIVRIASNPRQFPLAHKDARRALLRRFPYAVFFRVTKERVEVTACFHTSRDPRRWRTRV